MAVRIESSYDKHVHKKPYVLLQQMFQSYVCICLFVTLTRGLRFIRVDGSGLWLLILLLRREGIRCLHPLPHTWAMGGCRGGLPMG